MNPSDTISAISSAVGAAARMIVRVSGPLSVPIASDLSHVSPKELTGSAETFVRLHFAELSVPAALYVFRAPHSYTGDDVVEFHLPGNPLLARLLLDHLHRAGARPAEPGEFTARAFFNGRLDLAEAEGVAATIAAGNERELSAARQLAAGELSRRLRPAMDGAAETLALVEAGIDFADEEGVSFLAPADLATRVADADALLARLLEDSARFDTLAHEPTIVLVGRPNAGKSTLLNALAGRERAVTSPVPGTTRDALSAEVALPRGLVRLIDVAGVDDPDMSESDPIAWQMRQRATAALEQSDVVVLVRDVSDDRPDPPLSREPNLLVLTKLDLLAPSPLYSGERAGVRGSAPHEASGSPTCHPERSEGSLVPRTIGETSFGVPQEDARRGAVGLQSLQVSARTGHNLPALRTALDRLAFGDSAAGGAVLALNARHVESVREARLALSRAAALAETGPPEVIALELRDAVDALGRVLGAVTPDDLLGRIFSTFCIGK